MAKFSKHGLFAFSGKLGDKVGCNGRTGYYIRSASTKELPPPTEQQLATRQKFAMATRFLQPMKPLIDRSFQYYNRRKMTAMNKVMSITIKQCMEGEYPDFRINYKNVKISSGRLFNAPNPAIYADAPGEVTITWGRGSEFCLRSSDDIAVVQLYDPDQHLYLTADGKARRGDLIMKITVGEVPLKRVHAWLFFRSAYTKDVSTSMYAGEVEIIR